jgi:hypothetical protein
MSQAQKAIMSEIIEVQNASEEKILKKLREADFWIQIIPAKQKIVEMRAPNVLYTSISEEIRMDLLGLANIKPIKLEFEGELVLEDKGSDENGHFLDFNVRKNTLITELEGRLRLKKISNGISNGLKVGIFIYVFKINNQFLGSLGQNAADLILRSKLRELLELAKKSL